MYLMVYKQFWYQGQSKGWAKQAAAWGASL